MFESRLFQTVDVLEVAEQSDGYGGFSYSTSPTTLVSGLGFHRYNPSPRDREVFASQFGIESEAVVYMGTLEYYSGLENNHILKVSATEQYRVLGAIEMYGLDSTPHHWSVVLSKEV